MEPKRIWHTKKSRSLPQRQTIVRHCRKINGRKWQCWVRIALQRYVYRLAQCSCKDETKYLALVSIRKQSRYNSVNNWMWTSVFHRNRRSRSVGYVIVNHSKNPPFQKLRLQAWSRACSQLEILTSFYRCYSRVFTYCLLQIPMTRSVESRSTRDGATYTKRNS